MAPLREPREDAIVDTVSITGLQRDHAIRWLKVYDNDANKAMDAFFENPNAILDQQSQVQFDEQQGQVGWNEDHFHVDKTDSTQHQLGIRPTDALRPSVFDDGAPSRPPSRVSARTSTAANSASQNATMESEDEQVKRAMAMSMDDSQTLPDQETAIHGHQAFGPATRDHYESDKWALAISGPQTQEILLNPEAADRKRPRGAPAFLKPSATGHRLPALVKILHAIPMAREALLNRTHVLPDYGYDKNWWDGTAIKFLKIVNLDVQGRQINSGHMIYEGQRLMAFLDETERAYGTTDVLANANVTGDSYSDKVKDFYNEWHDATLYSAPDAPLLDIFASVGTKASIENLQSERFCCLMAQVDSELFGKGLTLYEVLDQTIWGDNGEDEESFLEKVGDVFTLEVCNQAADHRGLGIEVPAIWYADRYLPSSTKQFKDMLDRKAKITADLDAQGKAWTGITQIPSSVNGAAIDASRLLSTAIKYFEQTADYRKAVMNSSGTSADVESSINHPTNPGETAQELKALSWRISNTLGAFEAAREKAYEQLKEISQMYTKPSDDPEQSPHRKYTLRGVSTTPHTTYVLEQTKPDDDDDMLSTEAKDWQWWKVEYVSSDPKPVVHEKVTEDVVLTAAKNESTDVLLVYASESAVSYKFEDLPQQLRNFVRADNLNFAKELEGSGYPKPASPTKRKVLDHDSDDLESHYQRSTPDGRNLVDTAVSNEDLEPKLPTYNSSPSPPPALSNQRKPSYRTGNFDDMIPVSLQGRQLADDHDEWLPDQNGMSNGQEMQERDGGQNLLRHQKTETDQYTFGSYVPEIDMGDEEEDTHQRGLRGG